MHLRPIRVRREFPLRAAYFRGVLRHVAGFPGLGLLCPIRHPVGIRHYGPARQGSQPQPQAPAQVRVRVSPCVPQGLYAITTCRLFSPRRNLRGFPGSLTHLFSHATACGLRRTSTPLPERTLLCCLRCTLKPSASATSLFRSCTSTSGSAISLAAYEILCLRLVHLVRPASRQNSAMDPRLDTGGWLALARRGLSPRKMRRALPGAITSELSGAALAASGGGPKGRNVLERLVRLRARNVTHS